jgi:di/tricarboxylate transporter
VHDKHARLVLGVLGRSVELSVIKPSSGGVSAYTETLNEHDLAELLRVTHAQALASSEEDGEARRLGQVASTATVFDSLKTPPTLLETASSNKMHLFSFALSLLLAIVLALVLDGGRLNAVQSKSVALFCMSLVLLVCQPFSTDFTSLIITCVYPLTNTLPVPDVYAFGTSNAFWLMFAGMALGVLIPHNRLDFRVGGWLKAGCGSVASILLRLVVVGALLCLFIPSSMVRTQLMLPIAKAIAKDVGAAKGTSLYDALLLSGVLSTVFAGAGIMTGLVPSLIIVETAANSGVHLGFFDWLIYMAPIFFVCETVVVYLSCLLVFRQDLSVEWVSSDSVTSPPQEQGGVEPHLKHNAMSTDEAKALAVFAMAGVLFLALGDTFISTSTVAMLCVVVAFFPGGIGCCDVAKIKTINVMALFYFVAVVAIGTSLSKSGVSALLGDAIHDSISISAMPVFSQIYVIVAVTALGNFCANSAVGVSIMVPAFVQIAKRACMNSVTACFAVAAGSVVMFFPFQQGPLLILQSQRQVSLRTFIMLMSVISACNLCLLTPLTILYWCGMGLTEQVTNCTVK